MSEEQKLRQAAEELSRRADPALTPPPLNRELLASRVEQAALRGKARRPSQAWLARLSDLFASRPMRIAAPAFCALLIAVGVWAVAQPSLPFQTYSSAGLPIVQTVRGDSAAWSGLGWDESAVLDGYTLEASTVASAATVQSTQALRQLTCTYRKGGQTAQVIVSEADLPLWQLLSAGEGKGISGTDVFFGHDEAAGLRAAVWQRDGLTLCVTTDGSAKELLRLVEIVLTYEAN